MELAKANAHQVLSQKVTANMSSTLRLALTAEHALTLVLPELSLLENDTHSQVKGFIISLDNRIAFGCEDTADRFPKLVGC